jgi:hypothetical protein
MANRGRPKKGTWVKTSEILRELGVSREFLLKRRETWFKPRIHWKAIDPNAKRVNYLWHRENVLNFWDQI